MNVFATVALIVMSVIIYFIYRAFMNTKKVELNHVHWKREDADSSCLRVLHISDMHMENISVSPRRLLELLSEVQFDLIALTGDYVDKKKSIPKLAEYLEIFRMLNPKYGIYAVFGNHDYVLRDQSFAELRNTLEHYGCRVLINESTSLSVLGKKLNIVGIDDFSTGRSDLIKSFQRTDRGINLVLTHDPNVILTMDQYDFHYMLAGHFHGGQICWPKPYHLVKMGKLVSMDMVKGMHNYLGKPFYISEGLGQTALNIRVGSRPEITIHHLPMASEVQKQETPKAV